MGAHAFLAPSAAPSWILCAGAALMRSLYPEPEDSPKAMEGTAAHWGAREMLLGGMIALGQVADNGVVLDEEMIQGVEYYVETINRDMRKDPMQMFYCEQPVSISVIHSACWGTPDFWAYRPGLLRIYDFKYGHQFVEVFENWQMILYVAGILDVLRANGYPIDENMVVEFVIVQPRSFHAEGHTRRWAVRVSALVPYFDALRQAATRATMPNAMVTTGTQCDYCSASHVCKANQADSMRSVDMSADAVPFALDSLAVGHELRAIERAIQIMESRQRGLKEQAERFVSVGQVVPFYQMGNGRGSTVWKKSKAEVIAFGKLMGVDFKKPDEVITPIQAKELPIDPKLVDAISEHRPGARKLIPINSLSVRKAFQQ